MKISGRSIRLSRDETKLLENAGPNGDEFRRHLRRFARARADQLGKSVEVYASVSSGKWMWQQFAPEE